MKHCLDKSFRYTPVREQGPEYLAKKFKLIRKQQESEAKETATKVQPIKRSA